MSHYDETPGALDTRSPVPDSAAVPLSTQAASGTGSGARAGTSTSADSELAELRRNLLIYGTAGQAARPATAVKAY